MEFPEIPGKLHLFSEWFELLSYFSTNRNQLESSSKLLARPCIVFVPNYHAGTDDVRWWETMAGWWRNACMLCSNPHSQESPIVSSVYLYSFVRVRTLLNHRSNVHFYISQQTPNRFLFHRSRLHDQSSSGRFFYLNFHSTTMLFSQTRISCHGSHRNGIVRYTTMAKPGHEQDDFFCRWYIYRGLILLFG